MNMTFFMFVETDVSIFLIAKPACREITIPFLCTVSVCLLNQLSCKGSRTLHLYFRRNEANGRLKTIFSEMSDRPEFCPNDSLGNTKLVG